MTQVDQAMSQITQDTLETMLHCHILLLEFSGTALNHQVTDIDFSLLLSSSLSVTLVSPGQARVQPGWDTLVTTTLVTATNTHQPLEPTQLLILNLLPPHYTTLPACLLCMNWLGKSRFQIDLAAVQSL